jgi:hypothetical protein
VPPEDDEALLAQVPPVAATLLRRALDHGDRSTAEELIARALEVVHFPKAQVYALPSELEPELRAVAELLATRGDFKLHPYAIPGHGPTRRRWLGLDPGGALETVTVDGAPLWRALQQAGLDRARSGAILNALPLGTMLRAIGEMYPVAYGLHASPIVLQGKLRVWAELADEGGAWATEQAQKWSALAPDGKRQQVPEELKALVFLALVRAKVPIDPAWDVLLPAGLGARVLGECLRALPDERRGPALVHALRHLGAATAIERGLAVLEESPSALLTKAILLHLDRAGAPPRDAVLERLRAIAARHPVVAEVLPVEREPLQLECTAFFKPTSVSELDDVQREQLRLAGQQWDGKDLPAKDRLAKDGGEASFAGLLQYRTFSSPDGNARYDAVLFMGDSGAVYEAGTTTSVGTVVHGVVRSSDRELAAALGPILYAQAPESERTPPKKQPAAKKAAAKKPAAKKAAPEKPAPKKAAPKKPTAEKPTAKKATRKKKTTKDGDEG